MKTIRYLLLTALALGIAFSSCSTSSVNKDDINAFLNWYIENYHTKNLSDSLIPLNDFNLNLRQIYSAKDSVCKFSTEDQLFISTQLIKNNKIKTLEKADFNNVEWEASKSGSITYLSLPVFSKDKSLVIINRWYSCGPLCGDGGMEVFKLENGHWKKHLLHIPHIVS